MFYDANGKVIVDPTAVNQEAGLEIDSNEYIHLLKMLELDPNGTKVKIYNMDSIDKQRREVGKIVNEILGRRDVDNSDDEPEP